MTHPEVEQAVSYYLQGYTCSQSILATFAQPFGLKQDLAFKLGEPFGAGTSCTGDMCGAVTGAIMVLGLRYGSNLFNDDTARLTTYQNVQRYIQRFKSTHGSIQCANLLGYDLSDPQQLQAVREKKLFDRLCPELVSDAAQILLEML